MPAPGPKIRPALASGSARRLRIRVAMWGGAGDGDDGGTLTDDEVGYGGDGAPAGAGF